MSKILLVEPDFPYPSKSKNKANAEHKNFVPIGLLKLGAYYQSIGYKVKLVRGLKSKQDLNHFNPSKILITSLFTYWSDYVWQAISHYRELFPDTTIELGGIYATLHCDMEDFRNNIKKYKIKPFIGLHKKAEECYPDYSLLAGNIDYHVTHAMRGCIRKCKFCGTWKIEPERVDKPVQNLIDEIKAVRKRKIIFFDNNFLAHGEIEMLLLELSKSRIDGRHLSFESQSGFDGRLLEKNSNLAILLKKANFKNVRIAWDNGISDAQSIKKQIAILNKAGYKSKDISIFMIYNFDISYQDMLRKLEYCKKWGVQITDCRYRPLTSTYDHYSPAKYTQGQNDKDYYIHIKAGWSDRNVRDFRKAVRQHNIWIRYAKDKEQGYNIDMERWSAIHNTFKYFNMEKPPRYDIIKNSPTLQLRITRMNRVKNYQRKHRLLPLDLSKLKISQLDQMLEDILENIESPLFKISS